MMEGIEILNQYEVVVETTLNPIGFWITFGIVATAIIGLGIGLYISSNCSVGIIPTLTVIGVASGFLAGSMAGRIAEIPTKYEIRYEVQISENVSMCEFTEKYEIVNQRGNIFTIREKIE